MSWNIFKRMRTMTQKHYAEEQGKLCPVCKSIDIHEDAREPNFSFGTVTQEMFCDGCGSYWEEVYVLTGYDKLYDKNGKAVLS
jgi:hypothetical protein